MSDRLREIIAPAFDAPRSVAARAAWAAVGVLAVVLIIAAGLTTGCRGGGAARPWCPDNYTLSFKRLAGGSAGRAKAARRWGPAIDSADFSDLPRHGNECNALLGLPRVALLFLSVGHMHHDAMWGRWFAGVRGLIPKPALQAYGCSSAKVQQVRRACAVDPTASILDQQFLYNVYLHTSPDYEGHPASSVFHRHEIPDRIPTSWSSSNLTTATRNMLRHALRDPHAQQFLMLSDTGVPLYPATAMYLQLVSESRSRINACDDRVEPRITGKPIGLWEWKPKLETEGGVAGRFWRKHAQWAGLRRPHAEAIMQDTKVYAAFEKYCYSWWDQKSGYQQCKVDEHYFSTFLATQGLDMETDCKGYLVTSDWTKPGRHSGGPYEYVPGDVIPDLFEALRVDVRWGEKSDPSACVAFGVLQLARRGFVPVDQLTGRTCVDEFGGSWAGLTQECALFARKFPADTADIVLEVLSNNSKTLEIIP